MRWDFIFVSNALKRSFNKKLRGSENGAVTIYLAIVFSVLLWFVGLLADLGRIKVAQNQLRRVTDSSARSMMSQYDVALKDDYRLFGLGPSEFSRDFQGYVQINLRPSPNQSVDLMSYRVEKAGFYFTRPLDSPEVFKQQILEAVKYKAPIEIIREMAHKFKPLAEAAETFQRSGHESGRPARVQEELENIRQFNNEIKQDKAAKKAKATEIAAKAREIENWKKSTGAQGGSGLTKLAAEKASLEREAAALDVHINQLAAETKKARIRIEVEYQKAAGSADSEAVSETAASPLLQIDESSSAHQDRLVSEIAALQKDGQDLPTFFNGQAAALEKSSPGASTLLKADEVSDFLGVLFGKLKMENLAINLRDEIFINEYALLQFSTYTGAASGEENYHWRNSEVEYICYGGEAPLVAAVGQLYLIRFALDTAGYFVYSQVPGELLVRTLYSLVMGALEAAADTYKLMAGRESVPVVSTFPSNPFTGIQLNYQEHLRLMLLLNDDEQGKLARMTEIIKVRSNANLQERYTMFNGYVEVSIPMWFFPLAGIKNLAKGPFGTEIRDGRCFIGKNVEFSY